MSGKRKFSEENIAVMKATAALKAADRNPYSWNMDFIEYPDGSGYEGRFTKCGICTLMRELGLYDLTLAITRWQRQAVRQILCGSIHSPPAVRTATADIKRKCKIDTVIKSAMHVFC